MISGSRIAGRFAFCTGRARRIPPARVWRFCTAPPLPRFAFRTGSASFHAAVRDPNRFSSPIQVRAGRAGPFRSPPQSPAARAGRVLCATGAPLRRTGAGPRARTVRDPNRFSSPAQVRAGRAGPFRTPPQSPAARAARILCATGAPLRRTGTGPRARIIRTQTGFLLPHRSAPVRRTLPRPAPESGCRAGRVLCATGAPLRRIGAGPRARTVRDPNRFFPPAQVCAGPQDPSAPRPRGCCPRGPHPLRNGRAFALNRYGSPGPDRLDPVPPFSLCAAPFVTVFFSRCGLIFPACLIDGRK